jgi:hypothetical protein
MRAYVLAIATAALFAVPTSAEMDCVLRLPGDKANSTEA